MLNHPIEQLKLAKTKQAQFENKGLLTVEAIANFFPRKYVDFRNITRLQDVKIGEFCALEGVVKEVWAGSGKSYTATVEARDSAIPGYVPCFYVTWFGTDYYANQLVDGEKYIFCGKISDFRGNIQITAPLAFGQNKAEICKILPIYSKIQGMSNEYLVRQVHAAIDYLSLNDKGGEKELFAKSLKLMPKYEAIREIHQPTDGYRFKLARQRIDFEDIYDFYEDLQRREMYSLSADVQKLEEDKLTRHAISTLPFALTPDQASVIETIMNEAKQGRRIHTLVSGDVGCGKTMVAILSCIFMKENGYQSIVMAPTLVLARQHAQEFQNICEKLGVTTGLLTTETKKRERTKLLKQFAEGNLDILIGTHSVLSDDVCPYRLGLTIIDEEHKFGVGQKVKLEEYDSSGVHHISMTATPIPRSIARAVYGNDLDVLSIHSMPAGRKPVKTKQYFDSDAIFEKMYQEIEAGHQCYVVCPFIEDSDSPQFQDIISVSAASNMMYSYFKTKPRQVRTGIISGNQKQQSILETVRQFENKEFDILLSTTIIEVGVNVPNATVIAVMSAERFGLAGLHQLRGRVGRGNSQSYCLLLSKERTERLDILCKTTDGFVIAEEDLRLRGPGDVMGVAQSGASDVINTIIRRPKLSQAVRGKFFQKS